MQTKMQLISMKIVQLLSFDGGHSKALTQYQYIYFFLIEYLQGRNFWQTPVVAGRVFWNANGSEPSLPEGQYYVQQQNSGHLEVSYIRMG
jgi:hypothetical protein